MLLSSSCVFCQINLHIARTKPTSIEKNTPPTSSTELEKVY